eukprot:CAMPEP_0194352894 /NCGR_PEP_ID=MMETSP0174-20130528/1301_1 /TAXON_ID=216777 /ORGANISM="Proboscia alata, Strain PI-D3" /LENGTH=621 /DNA_ID=CAMNT_0039121211 /DNA_START=46 /DNA_END=1911 /DNA_ORIENTATION=+
MTNMLSTGPSLTLKNKIKLFYFPVLIIALSLQESKCFILPAHQQSLRSGVAVQPHHDLHSKEAKAFIPCYKCRKSLGVLFGVNSTADSDISNISVDDKGKLHETVSEYRKGLSQISRNSDDDIRGNRDEKVNGSQPQSSLDAKKTRKKRVTMKFGGSSLANADRIDHVAHLIKNQIENENLQPRAVICSAMGKTTNALLGAGDSALDGLVDVGALRKLHEVAIDKFDFPKETRDEVTALLNECEDMLNGVRLLQELSPKSLDQLVSYGERISVRIMAARLNQIGVAAKSYDAWEVGIITDSTFGDAHILKSSAESIRGIFETQVDPNVVAVVTGFIGKDDNGRITTLGRGGSDLTATAIGSACDLDEIQVWKDVDGILTSDPRVVPNASPVRFVSFEEASELAYFGAQVLHPIAMRPAMKKNIPVRVKNSYNPSHEGTVIKKEHDGTHLVTAITCKRNVKMLDIVSTRMLGAYGFLGTVFSAFEKFRMSVDVLASSEVSVSLTLDKKQKLTPDHPLLKELRECADVTFKRDRAILTLIADIDRSSEVLATVFRVFSEENIRVEMLSQGASKVNISFVLKDDDIERAIVQLHKRFFEENDSFLSATSNTPLMAEAPADLVAP